MTEGPIPRGSPVRLLAGGVAAGGLALVPASFLLGFPLLLVPLSAGLLAALAFGGVALSGTPFRFRRGA